MILYILIGFSIGVSLFGLGVSNYLLRQNKLQDECNDRVLENLELLKKYIDITSKNID